MKQKRGFFRRCLEISLLLHLLLLFLVLPEMEKAWSARARTSVVPAVPQAAEEKPPLRFELVDLAEERDEPPPPDPSAPLSDRDRRAHGGSGETSDRAASQGNTAQLIQRPAQVPPPQAQPQVRPERPRQEVPEPQPGQPQPEQRRPPVEEPDDAGEPQPEARRVLELPELSTSYMPPERPENPHRSGGEVDAGGISFDTQWWDWGPYAKAMLIKIRKNWRIPEIARLGAQGVARIRFYIERDGSITGLQILDESGLPPMDFAARDAIRDASPFAALPDGLPNQREGVNITFYYNKRPPGRDGD